MRSTLKCESKTHSGVLPQLRTLEVSVDVTGKVKPGTIETGPQSADEAGFQHGRGESPQGPSPSPRGEESSGVTRVFVLSKDGRPLMPCHAARARELLRKGRAVVVRRYPFVIRLKNNPNQPRRQPIAIKLDPGAGTTGIALVRLTSSAHIVLHLAELTHRGASIKESLDQRRSFRTNRRMRKTRYRAPRFNNRTRREGWLAPSLQSRVDNVTSWEQYLEEIKAREAVLESGLKKSLENQEKLNQVTKELADKVEQIDKTGANGEWAQNQAQPQSSPEQNKPKQ